MVGLWLFFICFLIFCMVVLGGVTRLTGSGLSMVDWKPIMGWLPPMTDAQWAETFAAYQQSPEYQKINAGFGVEGFKQIFWLEYLHRLLGRLVGLAFLIPLIFFWVTGRLKAKWTPMLVGLFVLGGLQGVLGWYMVKSGLVDDPHVSQYRLAAHLMLAIGLYCATFWLALVIYSGQERTPPAQRRWGPWALFIFTLFVATSGAFVAGLKAGFAFNTFPSMAGQYWPDFIYLMEPAWISALEDPATVQFNHRILAMTLFAVTIGYCIKRLKSAEPGVEKTAVLALKGAITLQLLLGIGTLLMRVPVFLGSAHQAGIVVLVTAMLFLCFAPRLAHAQVTKHPE